MEEDKKDKKLTCRKTTCRWLQEMTEAIHNLCPTQKIVTCTDNRAAFHLWNEYLEKLQETKCIRNTNVSKILAYELDYNEFRKE